MIDARGGGVLAACVDGFRAIRDHPKASGCSNAHERTERTTAMFGSCSAIFGISPCGNAPTPGYLVGRKLAGVQGPVFKSKVSVWLAAPDRVISMQFRAVPSKGGAAFAITSIGRLGSKKYPPREVARWRKNIRRPM